MLISDLLTDWDDQVLYILKETRNALIQLLLEQNRSAFSIMQGRCSSTESVCRNAGVITYSVFYTIFHSPDGSAAN